MDTNEVLNYLRQTPGNTNPNYVKSLLHGGEVEIIELENPSALATALNKYAPQALTEEKFFVTNIVGEEHVLSENDYKKIVSAYKTGKIVFLSLPISEDQSIIITPTSYTLPSENNPILMLTWSLIQEINGFIVRGQALLIGRYLNNTDSPNYIALEAYNIRTFNLD